jgi:predicted MPP superfamily phosphohydrolase
MPSWISRRTVLKGLVGTFATLATTGAYAFGIEPYYRLRIQRYALTPKNWTPGLRLRLAVIADLHASEPQMSMARVDEVIAATNALGADAILLLGDYIASHRWVTQRASLGQVSQALARLQAPLGVHAILGNHDWWDDWAAQKRKAGPTIAGRELRKAGIPVLENDAVRLSKDGKAFWLAGLGDQIAFLQRPRNIGVDDLPGTLAKIKDDAPIILMAHEPDIFRKVPDRVALTLSGHTHGGQVRLFGWSPVVPSRYGNKYAYGHVTEGDRHMIVSGGLGCSILPVRFGVPPEIAVVELGGDSISPSA